MFKTEQHRITGKRGKALIWGIAISGGIQRQHLPHLLSGGGEEVGESAGRGAQIADAEAAGQRSEVEEDSTGSGKFHFVTIRRLAGSEQDAPVGSGRVPEFCFIDLLPQSAAQRAPASLHGLRRM